MPKKPHKKSKKDRGRPVIPAADRRSVLRQTRLTPNEADALEQAARERGDSVSEVLRAGALRYVRGEG